jgi:hypothetical protein
VNDYNPVSIEQNKEYGGFIYRNPDGTFSYTDPHVNKNAGVGNAHSLPRFWEIPIPPGTQTAGWYHTHAAFDPRLNGPGNPAPGSPGYKPNNDFNNDFSPDNDIPVFVRLKGLPGMLGTPNGPIKWMPPNPGNPGHGIPAPVTAGNCGCN